MQGIVAYKLVAYKKKLSGANQYLVSLANVEDFFNANMFFKWKYVRINDYSFKYVCVVSCLKICFYCLTFSAMSNLNSADFTTRNQSSGILILKTKILLQFQNKMNSEIIGFQLMYFRFALELSDIDL